MADGTMELAALRDAALAWAAGDVDAAMRTQLEQLVAELDADVDAADPADVTARAAQLHELVGSGLAFGTAGLRGRVGPGPNRMNRAVVIRATRGLVDHLLATDATAATRGLVVAFDARHDSARFARDVAAVAAAAGMLVHRFPTHQPTPLGAFAQKDLDAAACVVVTASHNPPADNGYKVYVEGAAQIVPPTDAAIASAIDAVGPAREVPRLDDAELDGHPLVRTLGDDVAVRYLAAIPAARPQLTAAEASVPLRIAYTPLHGVGRDMVLRALADAGYDDVHVAPTQSEPDGDFPTVAFPNPEEPGALDAVLELAREVDADLVLANDPDGDRLAVAVPDGAGGFVPLSGNRIGVLLAEHCLAGLPSVPEVAAADAPATPLVISSIVSTPMLAAVAAAHGARCEVTLTGFKWICTAAQLLEPEGFRLAYGFEEALGSAVGGVVADKDGISAAVAFADLARRTKHRGLTMLDALRELHVRHGLWVSHQKSLVHEGAEGSRRIAVAMARLADAPPTELAGAPVLEAVDFRSGAEHRPRWLGVHDLIVLTLAEGRVMIRPSGTEPKCKIYVDVRTDLPEGSDAVAERAAGSALAARAAALADDLARIAGL
jgi:phosphomannomutase